MKIRSKIFNIQLFLLCLLYSIFRGKSDKLISNPKNILILRWKSHMGDVVYITPLFRAVKEKYPASKLYALGAGRVEEVIRHNPDIDEYIDYDGDFFGMVRKIKRLNFDFACLANTGSSEGLALLYLAGVKSICSFSTIDDKKIPSLSYNILSKLVINKPFYTGCYVPPQYLALLEPIGANNGDAHFRLYFSKKAGEKVDEMFKINAIENNRDFVVAFAPGGAVEERWWPAERFARLAEFLHDKYDAKILILGAGKDEKAISAMIGALNKNIACVNLLNQNLDEFKATISKCDMIIGNDSGPMVTADAFDVANLVFVGPTDEREYHRPAGPINRIVKSTTDKINDITTAEAMAELEIILSNFSIF